MSATRSLAATPWLALSFAVVLPLAAIQGQSATAADGFSRMPGSIVSGLAMQTYLQPVDLRNRAVSIPAARQQSAARSSLARQSVPSRDRATTYAGGELFANSKTALPLLVADLEPRPVSTARPMAGRSVGARPAAAWTGSRLPVRSEAPVQRTPGSWAEIR